MFIQQIENSQKKDKFCVAVMEVLKPKSYDDFAIRNEILFKECEGKFLFVIPKSMEYNVVKQFHDKGHFCDSKVRAMLSETFFIDDIIKKIKKVSSNCVQCILVNRKSGRQECFYDPLTSSIFHFIHYIWTM